MREQQDEIIVDLPLDEVRSRLCRVEDWPRFIRSVDSVQNTGPQRYLFRLVDGRSSRECTVLVSNDLPHQTIRWKALKGPTFAGSFRLHDVGGGRTRVELRILLHPATFLAGLADMATPGKLEATVDLQDLDHYLQTT